MSGSSSLNLYRNGNRTESTNTCSASSRPFRTANIASSFHSWISYTSAQIFLASSSMSITSMSLPSTRHSLSSYINMRRLLSMMNHAGTRKIKIIISVVLIADMETDSIKVSEDSNATSLADLSNSREQSQEPQR